MRPVLRLPGRWPVRFSVVQWLDGAAKVSPVSVRARLSVDRASLDADPAGPLGFLAGRRPLLSFGLQEFRMNFGQRVAGSSGVGATRSVQ